MEINKTAIQNITRCHLTPANNSTLPKCGKEGVVRFGCVLVMLNINDDDYYERLVYKEKYIYIIT